MLDRSWRFSTALTCGTCGRLMCSDGSSEYSQDIFDFSESLEDKMMQSRFYVFLAVGKLLFGTPCAFWGNEFRGWNGWSGTCGCCRVAFAEEPPLRVLMIGLTSMCLLRRGCRGFERALEQCDRFGNIRGRPDPVADPRRFSKKMVFFCAPGADQFACKFAASEEV